MGSAKAVEKMVVKVPREKFFEVITEYEKLPSFIPELDNVKVTTTSGNMNMVTYSISLLGRAISYTLQLTNYPSDRVAWKLVKGDFMKKNEGRWLLEEIDENTTGVTYELEMAFPMIVPSAIVAQLQKNSLPKLMDQYKTRAEALYG